MKPPTLPDFTPDTLFNGRLHCLQPRRGYRFSLDSVLLAHFVETSPTDSILDLGAGCGVVSLILAYRWPTIRLTALELQEQLALALHLNIEMNHLSGRLRLVKGDLRQIKDIFSAGSFTQVICNPPYYKCGSGRCNPNSEQAVARHEIMADLEEIIGAAAFAVRNRGRALFVYPAERAATLLTKLRRHHLEPKRLQIIYGHPGGPGKLILVDSRRGGGEELQIMRPFYIYNEPGSRQYSPE
ncbi:MAG: methyltransferase, partial [Deltaproteobacteria bacterium]|nr:methyltransferase [Deltaproteobacteria bacterium]